MDAKIEPFYEKKVTCLYCDHTFNTLRVRSRFSVPSKIDSDFCPHYREGSYNAHYYYVNVCPKCGFTFSDEFSKDFYPGTKKIIQKKIIEQLENKHLNVRIRNLEQAVDTYKLAIYTGTLKKEKHAAIAGLCLRLAWIYRIENKEEQEKRFLELALKEYEESYLHSDFTGTSMSEMKVLFMIGELSRRLGDFAKAISYFKKVLDHPDKEDELKMANLAREQWQITVQQYRDNKDSDKV